MGLIELPPECMAVIGHFISKPAKKWVPMVRLSCQSVASIFTFTSCNDQTAWKLMGERKYAFQNRG